MAKISVLTTVYNEDFEQVERAIKSVKDQTDQNLDVEHVIIVDNPEYKYIEKLKYLGNTLSNKKFHTNIIQNSKNLGLSKSLNKAIFLSSAEILARLDSDDWMNKNRLAKQFHVLEARHADIVYSDTLLLASESKEPTYSKSLSSDRISSLLPFKNFISHSSVMFLKSSIISVGMYRELEPAEDYDLWLRFKNSGKIFAYIDEPLTLREIRYNSVSNSNLYYQIKMASYVRKLNRKIFRVVKYRDKLGLPKNLKNQKKLQKINLKINKFRSEQGTKKVAIGLSSLFIMRMSIDDVLYKIILESGNLKQKLRKK